ncbi:hypothetical protein VCR31J2_1310862 [Vibrio coralliirubri]|uniref:Uncharacterized protein n=1 Tax=Vibrio coralliirubri TaxID=1516159 RepID=A0AA86WUU1_9VIBR|nr:hypothetical protein VCR31J2_1310862 [Vibrio coralliirubri]
MHSGHRYGSWLYTLNRDSSLRRKHAIHHWGVHFKHRNLLLRGCSWKTDIAPLEYKENIDGGRQHVFVNWCTRFYLIWRLLFTV